MHILRSALALVTLPFLLSAQDPSPSADSALRSRVEEFFQLQTNRQFRQAERFVAEDTKDYYYESRKPDIKSFRIAEVKFSPDFRTAKVMMSVHMAIPSPTVMGITIDAPFPTEWKLENGEWCLFIDQSKLLDTPFGRMNPGTTKEETANATRILDRATSAALSDGVAAQPRLLHLDPNHPSPQKVTVINSLPGPVTVDNITGSRGLNVVIAKRELAADQSTEITVSAVVGSPDRPKELILGIGPLGQAIHITLDYAAQ